MQLKLRYTASRTVPAFESVHFMSLMCIVMKRYQSTDIAKTTVAAAVGPRCRWIWQNGPSLGSLGPSASGCRDPGLFAGHCFMADQELGHLALSSALRDVQACIFICQEEEIEGVGRSV